MRVSFSWAPWPTLLQHVVMDGSAAVAIMYANWLWCEHCHTLRLQPRGAGFLLTCGGHA